MELPCGRTLASDVAAVVETREEGGMPPIVDRGDTTMWMIPAEAVEAAMAEA